jgi:hypothetical protein
MGLFGLAAATPAAVQAGPNDAPPKQTFVVVHGATAPHKPLLHNGAESLAG